MIGSSNGHLKDTKVSFQADNDFEVQAALLWVTRHAASFEIRDIGLVPNVSDKLEGLKIVFQDHTIYTGTAVVRGLVSCGITQHCEVTLSDQAWLGSGFDCEGTSEASQAYKTFLSEWQRMYQVAPDYKVVVADIHSFLTDLNLWLQQVEMDLDRNASAADRERRENCISRHLKESIVPAIEHLFSRFEEVCKRIPPDLVPAHRSFSKRHLHPLVLCAPFIHRTFVKPLGYAGDYEMMNMIVRNGLEGESLFAKVINAYMLDQAPAHGVRSRVDLLHGRMRDETMRIAGLGRTAKILSVACGPAREVQEFLSNHALSDSAEFHLLDFNQETLNYTRQKLDEVKRVHRRKAKIELIQESVQSLLRRGSKGAVPEQTFDMIYCSGLYDYLSDNVCNALNSYLYDRLRPGGVMLIGNFAPNNPIRNIMEHVLEWFLIYRDSRQLARLAPSRAPVEECKVVVEASGTNIFLEVRKPE